MNLMKWLRKNNKKLMAIVVIVLMIAFIGGSSFQYLFRGSGGMNAAVAYFGVKQKISHADLAAANNEVELLSSLGGDSLVRQQGMAGLLLSELVFRQNREAMAMDMARQAIQKNRFRISDKQLSAMSETQGVPGPMFWILLCREAQEAGIRISNDEAGRVLEQIIPQLYRGGTYQQVIPGLMNRFGVPEERILTAFSKLIAVLQYSQVITSLGNATNSQIRHLARSESESLSAEMLPLKASCFVNKDEKPSDEAIQQQFDKYKDNFPGQVSETNPFGFGYRLPDRVQFEYLAVKLPEVAAVTKLPTEEEAEQYYQKNRDQQFTQQVPKDPNDPDSPRVAKVRNYAEVAETIMNQLRRQRILTKAEQIVREARAVADVNLPTTGRNGGEATTEERRQNIVDYARIAADLGKKHNLALYSGRTGLLSALNIRDDKVLRRMSLPTSGYSSVPLSQYLFSVKELGDHATVLLSMSPALMYASSEPVRDPMSAMSTDMTDQIMMIVRVVDAQKNAAPSDVGVAFSTQTLGLGTPADPKTQSFSVREQVVDDLKILSAWSTTKSKAEEFMALAAKDGWDKALTQFNKLYGAQAKAKPEDPNVFKTDLQPGLTRISDAELQVMAAQVGNSPAAPIILAQARNEGKFADRLFSLIPPKSTSPAQVPVLVEFQPHQSYYVVKSLTMQRLAQEDFQKMKGSLFRQEEYAQIESLAAVHFNPQNILKRMNFRFAHPREESSEGEAAAKSKEAS
jgi:hypothetical protein